MRLEKLDIKGFGKLNNFEISFDRGFNVIYGENESGKSTIEAFIKAMFYSLKSGRNSKEGSLTPLKRYKPWSGTDYRGSMKYTLDNGQGFIVERNFDSGNTKVYDSLYKEITKTFEQRKDKGPLFAISHIGLTESCFDKTLFIRQMATKLDACDSHEILDRLSNISETGFEDVSYKRAYDAIKEAIKNHVGTDKTSTRPLDIINSKLDQLNIEKQRLIEVKQLLFSAEEEITTLNNARNQLEEEKTVMLYAKDVIRLREELDVYKRKKKDLNEISLEISELVKECESLTGNISQYKRAREKLGIFSSLGFEDADDLYTEYTKLENINNENERFLAEIQKLKNDADKTEIFLQNFRAFNALGEINIGDSTPSTEFNLESFKNAEIQREVSALNFKSKAIFTSMAIVCVAFAAMLFYGFSKQSYTGIIGAVVLLVIFPFLAVLKVKNKKLLNSLKNSKAESDIKVKFLYDKVENQKLLQADVFKMLDVTNIDEFLKKKVLYDSKVYELERRNERINELKAGVDRNCNMILELSRFIKEKLLATAIISSVEGEIRKEQIEAFRKAINKYKEIEPYLNNGEDKLEDLYKRIENLYSRTYFVCGQKVNNKEELNGILYEIENKIKNLYKDLDIYAYKIKSTFADIGIKDLTYDDLMEIILDLGIGEAKGQIEEMTQKILDRLNETQLSVKEKEMALEALNDDNNELERLEEDIRKLEIKKVGLEDIGFSLRTALEVLDESNTEIKRDFAPVLNNCASKIVSSITANRYGELKVDENLTPRTTDPFSKDIVPISMLSGGTVDQMYLALRIALVQTIENKSEKLPLIMDEVLAQYDDTRSLEAIKVLKDISNERQIILFTCKSREVELVKFVCNNNINIIELI